MNIPINGGKFVMQDGLKLIHNLLNGGSLAGGADKRSLGFTRNGIVRRTPC